MGRPSINMVGLRFGKLIVLARAGSSPNKAPTWYCRCDCGNEKIMIGANLRSGVSLSCGCERLPRCIAASKNREFCGNQSVNITGMKFGRWTAISPTDQKSSPNKKWHCRCDCGTERIVAGNNLRSGKSKSCGCFQREIARTLPRVHRMSHHPIHNSWHGMRARCLNRNHQNYADYGGRGIKICKRWDKFINFLQDMYATWAPGLSLDRIDVNGNYEPSNCRWATTGVQATNKRPRRWAVRPTENA